MLSRRQLALGAGASALLAGVPSAAARSEPSPFYDLRDITVEGERRIGRRFTMLVPKHTSEPVPVAVLLHGLGETHDERMGAYAWVERYGLGGAYDRLCRPPVAPLDRRNRYWTPVGLSGVNERLSQQPFRGLAVVCPYTPNVYKARPRAALLDDYAEWIVSTVVPRARRETATLSGPAHTSLDGCSLGGYVGIEVFLRKPEHFGAWGTVQGALGAHRITSYAERIAEISTRLGKRPIHVETSTSDSFRQVNEQFAAELRKRGVVVDFTMPPGPHNQPFLRDSGTLEMLLWHDRLPR